MILRWLLVMLSPSLASAGALDEAGRRTRDEGHDSSAYNDNRDDSDDDDDDDDDDDSTECDGACAEAMGFLLFSPWSVPRLILNAEYERAFWYERYPYAEQPRYLSVERSSEPKDELSHARPLERRGRKIWAAQTALEGGVSFSGVARGGLAARLLMPVALELQTQWLIFTEQTKPSPEEPRPERDVAALGNVGLNWRFAQSENVQFRSGIAYQHWMEDAETQTEAPLTESERSQSGFDLSYGFDAFVGRPLVLSAEAHVGVVGEAITWQLRGTLGALLGPVELFAGYHAVDVAGIQLGGPLLGARGYW